MVKYEENMAKLCLRYVLIIGDLWLRYWLDECDRAQITRFCQADLMDIWLGYEWINLRNR